MELKNERELVTRNTNYENDKNINKDLITEMPSPEIFFHYIDNRYFFTEPGLETYCKKNNIPISDTHTVEYYRHFAGRNDVIKVRGKYYTAVDEDIYAVYNYDESVACGKYIWEFEYGNLRREYQILKKIEVDLEDDIYGKIDERYKYIKQKIKEKNEDFKRKLNGNN